MTLAANDSNKDEIKIYPTRTKDIINIEFPDKAERIVVFDMNGKLIFESNNASKSQKINLNNFSSGVYIISVKIKSGVVSKKIIKE